MGYNLPKTPMKKTKTMFILLLLCLAALNVQAQKKGEKVGYDEATAISVEPVTSAHVTPVVADVTVSPTKITHSETFTNELSQYDIEHPNTSAEIHYLKNYTLNKATKKSNADLIIAPIYEITTSADMNTISVIVSGYPATYTNFRTATEKDFELIKTGHETSKLTPEIFTMHSNTEKNMEK